jgi:ribosomal protein S18 acetylase RimI-like enzyme
LAVSEEHRGRRLGAFLLLDALKYAVESSETIGSAFVVVDAKDGNAAAFYRKCGFAPLADNPARLYMPMSDVAQLFAPT